MKSLHLVLNRHVLARLDRKALPAICSLCKELGVRFHWNGAENRLYIESPLMGKQLVISPGKHSAAEYLQLTGQIASCLRERLKQGGAHCFEPEGPDTPQHPDLLLRLEIESPSPWGVTLCCNWLRWSQGKRLAAILAETVAGACRIPNLGTQISLSHGNHLPSPSIAVLIGYPGTSEKSLQEEALAEQIAEGLYQGLACFWRESALETEAETETRLILDPDPEVVNSRHALARLMADIMPHPIRKRKARKNSPAPAADMPPPPPPAPAAQCECSAPPKTASFRPKQTWKPWRRPGPDGFVLFPRQRESLPSPVTTVRFPSAADTKTWISPFRHSRPEPQAPVETESAEPVQPESSIPAETESGELVQPQSSIPTEAENTEPVQSESSIPTETESAGPVQPESRRTRSPQIPPQRPLPRIIQHGNNVIRLP